MYAHPKAVTDNGSEAVPEPVAPEAVAVEAPVAETTSEEVANG